VREAIGSGVDVARFTEDALRQHGAVISPVGRDGGLHFDLAETPRALRDMLGNITKFKARFELPLAEKELYLSRTHPVVEGLAAHVLDTALDPLGEGIARRSGVVRTSRAQTRTTLLLLRFRYHIVTQQGAEGGALLAEDCRLAAFTGSPQNAVWLSQEDAQKLLDVKPDANVPADAAATFLERVINDFEHIQPHINEIAEERGRELLEAHRRVRTAARLRSIQQRVETQLPPDVLGVYVYLPVA
jgi:hypothetical protein